MPDTPFKSMSRDPEDKLRPWDWRISSDWVACERCGGGYRIGGWPFCRGEGHAEDHWR